MTLTWNPMIRSQMPFPLGHQAMNLRKMIMAVNNRYKVYLNMRQNITTLPGLEPGIP